MMLKILLVDDNQTFLASIKNFLLMLPNVKIVGEAHDGQQALALAGQLQPDLILLDIVMPGSSGLEVAKILQSWPKSPQIVFLTMHDNEFYRAAAKALGTLGLVGKSNFVADLLPVISALVTPVLKGAE